MLRFIKHRLVAADFNIFLVRQLRSVAKTKKQFPKTENEFSEVGKQFPKLIKKGNVTTLDNNIDAKLSSTKSFKGLDETLKKLFTDPSETHSIEELKDSSQYDAIPNRQEIFENKISEEKEHARMIRKQMIKRSYFKDRPETNLLTYNAKVQMRYLHRLDPVEWTAEKLAESFPASVLSIKKIIRWDPPAMPEDKIKAHDEIIAQRWKALKSNRDLSDISPMTVKLYREGKLLQDFYAGNISLPQPPKREIELKRKRIGEYGSMVKKYVDYKKKKEEETLQKLANSNNLKLTNDLQNEHAITKSDEQVLRKLTTKYPTRSEVEDEESATYLAREPENCMEPDILPSQFEENMMEEFSEKKHRSSSDQAYIEWMEKKKLEKLSEKQMNEVEPYDTRNYACIVKKFNFENMIELSQDQTGSKSNVAYIYDANMGYQHPFGKEIVQDRIKIPRHLRRKGATYKVGLCFYNEDGKFLYKLPTEINTDFI